MHHWLRGMDAPANALDLHTNAKIIAAVQLES